MTDRNHAAPMRAALCALLEAEVQRHGIVVWLDRAKAFESVALALAQPEARRSYALVRFEGSWLQVMLALDEHTRSVDRPRLVVYLPGYDARSVLPTPALSVFESASRFVPTVPQLLRDSAAGVIAPSAIEAILAEESIEFSRAEQWLVRERDARGAERRDAFSRLSLPALLDELLVRTWAPKKDGHRVLDLAFETAEDVLALEEYLRDRLGLDWWFRADVCKTTAPTVGPASAPKELLSRLVDDLLTWLLTVEYVRDLRADERGQRKPSTEALAPIVSLHDALAKDATELCAHLRKAHEQHYPPIAHMVEQRLGAELATMSAEDLGRIDTFAIENERVLDAAVHALTSKHWKNARERAQDRLNGDSIWLRLDQLHRWEWQLVLAAAEFGDTLERVGMPPKKSVERTGETLADLVAWYETTGCEVDLRHRRFEQEKAANLDPRFAHFADLQRVVLLLREQYRAWVDAHAARWTECCELRGYLAPSELQQRTLYEQIVQPVIDEGSRVALFLVDALRFEMAKDLADMLRREASTTVTLRARVAELPTITAVGMNCVVPVSREGKLVVAGVFNGFRTGEITVSRPDHRADAAGRRSLGKKALLLDLASVLSDSAEKLGNRIRTNKLVLVQTREIDDAGEANVGVRSFQASLQDLLAAFRLLEAAGIQRFVFVADHGFLLQDECTKVIPFGKKTEPRPRYHVDTLERREADLVAVNPRSLGYEGEGLEGKFLLFRKDTALFATGNAGAAFVHGGNSPQERVIPVLDVRTAPKSSSTKKLAKPQYALVAEHLPDERGVHRLRFIVEYASDPDSLFVAKTVAVGLRARCDDPTAIVSIRDVSRGTHSNGQLLVAPAHGTDEARAWTEVFFTIESATGAPAQIELFLADAVHEGSVKPVAAWFESFERAPRRTTASGHAIAAQTPPAAPSATVVGGSAIEPTKSTSAAKGGPAAKRSDEPSWLEGIPDENARKVLARIAQYGMVTEHEATELLGSPRAMRKFSAQLDQWIDQRLVPIRIRVDAGPTGKRYTKEGDR
jgi:hypothetical protein